MGLFGSAWPERERVEAALSSIFNLSGFRPGQEEIIRDITSGHDTLAVMPTGGGKSLCYQLPAVVTPGLTLVISPLIALMKDQVDALRFKGVQAASLHSGLTFGEQQSILDAVNTGSLKILFIAPERLQTPGFQSLLTRIHVGLVAVDEAHCISQWGHDFRPAYRKIGDLRTILGNPPTIALTATASHEVQQDIVEQLHLDSPRRHILGFDRQNLLYSARIFKTDAQKTAFILEFVEHNLQQRCFNEPAFQGCGIIYTSTIRQGEEIHAILCENGIRAGLYHASLPADERNRIQDAFKEDAYHCLVATNAFGMGVDKPNIRYVIHMSLSGSVEAYTQEAGRAGRDRKPAQCILLFSPKDVKIQQRFIQNAAPDILVYKAILEAFADSSKGKLPTPGAQTNLAKIQERYAAATGKSLNEGKANVALRKLKAFDHIDIALNGNLTWLSKCPRNLARNFADDSHKQKECAEKRLMELIHYVYEKDCRTKFILKYFGSREHKQFGGCCHCDCCHAIFPKDEYGEDGPFPPEPNETVILKIIATVARFNKHKSPLYVLDLSAILHGNADAHSADFVTTFAALAYFGETELRILIALMLESDLLAKDRSHSLWLTEKGRRYMQNNTRNLANDAPALGLYMSRRFPNAACCGQPWSPSKLPNSS